MTTQLLCIDPGRRTGWALFEGSSLVGAGVDAPEVLLEAQPWWRPVFANWTRHALLEHPRWYPHDHKDVNDLIDLASKKGRFEQLLREHFNVEDVWPRTWKGNVPKAIMTERIVSRLSEEERALVVLTPRSKAPEHNCVDAIGIGLWRIGRL